MTSSCGFPHRLVEAHVPSTRRALQGGRGRSPTAQEVDRCKRKQEQEKGGKGIKHTGKLSLPLCWSVPITTCMHLRTPQLEYYRKWLLKCLRAVCGIAKAVASGKHTETCRAEPCLPSNARSRARASLSCLPPATACAGAVTLWHVEQLLAGFSCAKDTSQTLIALAFRRKREPTELQGDAS